MHVTHPANIVQVQFLCKASIVKKRGLVIYKLKRELENRETLKKCPGGLLGQFVGRVWYVYRFYTLSLLANRSTVTV